MTLLWAPHRWIYLGSANANFYYAITLLFGAWQVRSSLQSPLQASDHAYTFKMCAVQWRGRALNKCDASLAGPD